MSTGWGRHAAGPAGAACGPGADGEETGPPVPRRCASTSSPRRGAVMSRPGRRRRLRAHQRWSVVCSPTAEAVPGGVVSGDEGAREPAERVAAVGIGAGRHPGRTGRRADRTRRRVPGRGKSGTGLLWSLVSHVACLLVRWKHGRTARTGFRRRCGPPDGLIGRFGRGRGRPVRPTGAGPRHRSRTASPRAARPRVAPSRKRAVSPGRRHSKEACTSSSTRPTDSCWKAVVYSRRMWSSFVPADAAVSAG